MRSKADSPDFWKAVEAGRKGGIDLSHLTPDEMVKHLTEGKFRPTLDYNREVADQIDEIFKSARHVNITDMTYEEFLAHLKKTT
ncbi:hypothetical protein SAMN06265338_1335 [Rhodoblastus acidophilus]|uniref:Uncharacterized protein n=1 Tax=Rhodoblastus acidophilus TaxID=1074 RepID=A0A212SEN6_RHOAC|nr:hypothetical protein [Rhodoblastus acidophilus]SNB84121.1 hypothetical protein SAMN06265338_1335 [Rhodoblastus acidophilus]